MHIIEWKTIYNLGRRCCNNILLNGVENSKKKKTLLVTHVTLMKIDWDMMTDVKKKSEDFFLILSLDVVLCVFTFSRTYIDSILFPV